MSILIVKKGIFIVNRIRLWDILCNFAVRKKIVMITLSFPWLVALVVLLFLATLALLACFKSPMRKWVCFGLSTVSVAYLLYIMMWHESIGNGPMFDWYLVGFVGIFASMALASIGIMDYVKPVVLPVVAQTKELSATPSVEYEEESQVPISEEGFSDEDKDGEDEKRRKDELIGKVLPWFLDQINLYSDEEQNAIKACAIEFVNDGTIPNPAIVIAKGVLSQQQLMELCSAFILLDKDRSECAEFAKAVFGTTFNNTEISTLEKKIKGKDRMQILIDTYWEAEGLSI